MIILTVTAILKKIMVSITCPDPIPKSGHHSSAGYESVSQPMICMLNQLGNMLLRVRQCSEWNIREGEDNVRFECASK